MAKSATKPAKKAPAKRKAADAGASPIPLDELKRIPAFAVLSDAEASQLLSVMSIRPVARGERIFAEGETGDGLYAILSGRVSIVKKNRKGGEREVATLDRNEVLGELDLISDRAHSSGAKGAEGSRLLFLPKAEFQRMLKDGHPGATAMVMYFARMLAGRLDANNKRMMAMLDSPEEKRTSSEFADFKKRLLSEWSF